MRVNNQRGPHVVIAVPCYNEAKRLPAAAFLDFEMPGYRTTLLLVNDGSRDTTLALLERLRDQAPGRIEVLDLQPNGGKAEAVRRGMLHAFAHDDPDYVGFWDADLATPFSELPIFCKILDARPEIEMVFGSRVKLLGRTVVRKAYRHYFGRVFATAVSLLLNLPIYDSQCGAKLFRATPAVRDVFAAPFLSRWVFDVEIIARYKNILAAGGRDAGQAIYELPLREWRDVGDSKVGIKDAVNAYLDLARIYRAYRLGATRASTLEAARK